MAIDRATYRVVLEEEMWVIKNERGLIIDRTHTKEQAVEFGRRRATSARVGRLIIHADDGTVERDITFGQEGRPQD